MARFSSGRPAKYSYGLLLVPVEELQPGMVIEVWWLAGRDRAEQTVRFLGGINASRLGEKFATQTVMMCDGQELRNYDGRRLTVGSRIATWPANTQTAREGIELVRRLDKEAGV